MAIIQLQIGNMRKEQALHGEKKKSSLLKGPDSKL